MPAWFLWKDVQLYENYGKLSQEYVLYRDLVQVYYFQTGRFKLFETSGMLGSGCVEEGWQDSPYERKVAQETWNKNKMASFHMDCQLFWS